MKFRSDIDIDFGNRDAVMQVIKCTPASINRDGQLVKHNTGVYVTDIPRDPFTGQASLDHKDAEDRGYMKLDFLNVSLYTQIKSEHVLNELLAMEPDWHRLNNDQAFFEQLIHVNNHWAVLKKMPEPVDTIPRLAMLLAIIRPAKRHLIGETWKTVAQTIWDKTEDGYQFKKSHAVAYAHLVAVNMNAISLGYLANQGN